MLIRKTFRVFRKNRGFIGYAAVIALILLMVNFDLFGYESYVPDQENVEIMYVGSANYFDEASTIALSPEKYDPERHRFLFGYADYINNPPSKITQDMLYELRQTAGVIENPGTIQKALELHRHIADNADRLEDTIVRQVLQGSDIADPYKIRYVNLSIAYRLKGGRIVRRSYSLPYLENDGDPMKSRLTELFSSPEMMVKYNPILRVEDEDINSINVTIMGSGNKTVSITDGERKTDILEAIKLDISGMDPLNAITYTRRANPINVEISFNFKEQLPAIRIGGMKRIGQDSWIITLMTDNENTIDCLMDAGIISPEEIAVTDRKY